MDTVARGFCEVSRKAWGDERRNTSVKSSSQSGVDLLVQKDFEIADCWWEIIGTPPSVFVSQKNAVVKVSI